MRRCLAPLALLLATIGFASTASADITYYLTDYGTTIQNGFTLSGTIVVSDSAADDGTLSSGEIVSWQFSATDGVDTYAGSSSDTGANISSGAAITATEISTTGYFQFGTSSRSLSYNDGANQYRLQDFSQGDIWYDTNFTHSPIQIAGAAAVPETEPTLALLALTICLGFGVFVTRRRRKTSATAETA